MNIFAFADEASPMIDEQIAALTRNGLNGLEIRSVDGANVSGITLDKAKEVRKKLDDAGLITWSIGSPLGKTDVDSSDFDAHLDTLKHTIEVAHVLGAENIRMFSFFIPKEANPADYKSQVMDRLGEMLKISAGTGVKLCHENEKGIYGDIAPRCLEIHQAFPELGGIFDPANYIQCHQDTMEGWKMLRQYITYLHIKDAMADGHVVPAGHGIGNLKYILDDFQSMGGRNVTIEPHLTVFDGLKDLEREGQVTEINPFSYPSKDAAFDTAADALKKLL